jgi:uncharacterized protein YecT (DUF1311 family)
VTIPRAACAALIAGVVTLAAGSARAEGTDCAKATTPTERTICANPELRHLDTEMAGNFSDVLAATQGAARRALLAQQRTWLRERDRSCRDGTPDCLMASYRTRLAALTALTARISAGNPTLLDVTPVALLGTWKIEGYLVPGAPGRAVSDTDRPRYLPKPGTTVTGQPGKLCSQDGDCQPFGLDRQTLGAAEGGGTWLAALHLPPSTPFYVSYLSGKSDFGLIPRQDGSLLAQFLLCDKTYKSCLAAFQVWTPASPDAAVRVLARP